MPHRFCRGETLDVHITGNGPPLMLVHSLGTGAWLWRAEMERWASSFTVVAASARGHGGSTSNGGFSVREVAADMLAVAHEAGGTPFHLVGISMGGPIAAHMIDLAPESVASVVIADSFAAQGEAGAQRADAVATAIRSGSMAAYGQRYADETLRPASQAAHGAALAASIAAMEPETYIEAARAVFTADVRALYGQIRCPARVVVGTQDNRTPLPHSEEISRLIPQAELLTIMGAAHLANLDEPQGFDNAVLPFLRAHAGR